MFIGCIAASRTRQRQQIWRRKQHWSAPMRRPSMLTTLIRAQRQVLRTLQRTATHHNTLQHTATRYCTLQLYADPSAAVGTTYFVTHRDILQHPTTHCCTLQLYVDPIAATGTTHFATHCNLLQHTSTHCNTLLLCATLP